MFGVIHSAVLASCSEMFARLPQVVDCFLPWLGPVASLRLAGRARHHPQTNTTGQPASSLQQPLDDVLRWRCDLGKTFRFQEMSHVSNESDMVYADHEHFTTLTTND